MAKDLKKRDKAALIHARLKERIEALGTNPHAVSVAAGLDGTYLKILFRRPTAIPKPDQMEALAKAAQTTVDYLDGRSDAPGDAVRPPAPAAEANGRDPYDRITLSPQILAALSNPLPPAIGDVPAAVLRGDVRGANIDFPAIALLPTDVPVYGTAAGSVLRGAFQFEGGVIEYVRRPPGLAGMKTVYALYVEGASMVPEHHPGDLRFVHTTKPPRAGDSVIVQVRNFEQQQTEAFIGRYLKKTGTSLFLGKLNPESTVEIKLEYVQSIHKVLTVNEMFGI